MDHNLREMGISDQGVPRQMRRVAQAFYGRARAYDAALAQAGDDALTQALIRNVYAGAVEASVAAPRLAAYVRQAVEQFERQPFEQLRGGVVCFPEPQSLTAAAE
jgi:cytochrome b pre-mRNA-processing protein 3